MNITETYCVSTLTKAQLYWENTVYLSKIPYDTVSAFTVLTLTQTYWLLAC